VLVSVLEQERVRQHEHKDCAQEQRQVRELEPDALVVQAHRVLRAVLVPLHAARPLFPQQPPISGLRPTVDTDTTSTVRDRGNRIRFGIDTSYGSSQY